MGFRKERRKCLRNATEAASELEKHFVVVPWPMLYKVQTLWNEESTAVWKIETEWNPSPLPWLFVVVRLPYPSPHKQMVTSLACQVYTDENACACMCVCACVHVHVCVIVCVRDCVCASPACRSKRVGLSICLLLGNVGLKPLSSSN